MSEYKSLSEKCSNLPVKKIVGLFGLVVLLVSAAVIGFKVLIGELVLPVPGSVEL